MKRRADLARVVLAVVSSGIVACAGASRRAPVAAPTGGSLTNAGRELTADQQVAHVLGRLTFGARPGDVERVRAIGVDAWIERQLRPESIDDAPFEHFFAANYALLGERPGELERRFQPPGQLVNQLAARRGGGAMSADDSARLRAAQLGFRQIVAEVQSARVARAVLTERQFLEVMTDFWLNHFSVFEGKAQRQRYFLPEYENRVIRSNALGKFRTLLGAVARSEAMLFYLDNWQSQADSGRPRLAQAAGRGGRGLAGAPGGRGRGGVLGGRGGGASPEQMPQVAQRLRAGLNENYGRELLELHTLGVDGGYTQDDVLNAARAFTGWTIRPPAQGGGFMFQPLMHDAGEKRVLGHTLAARRGIEDGEELLDIAAAHPATARHIAFKLARRFVSDAPPEALVERAAATFTRTGGDIRETVRTIVTSPEFFSRAAWRAKVKSPFEVVVSATRALGGQPDPSPRMASIVAFLGQPIYGHQAPNGWPDVGKEWMNTGAILNRINFGMAVAAGRLPGISPFGFHGAESLRTAPLERQVDGVIAALLGGDASPETRSVLVSGKNPLAAPHEGVTLAEEPATGGGRGAPGGRGGMAVDPLAGPGGRALGAPASLRGLPLLVGLAVGAPEFQRR